MWLVQALLLLKMLKIIIKLMLITLILIGVICIFDARNITKKFFGFGDQNEGASGLKILGFIIVIISGIISVILIILSIAIMYTAAGMNVDFFTKLVGG